MNNLRDALRTFDRTVDESYYTANASGSNDKLEELFAELARAIIYGGHLRINDKFDIYVRSVEFYFHTEEKGRGNGFVRDPVMFYRSIVRAWKAKRLATLISLRLATSISTGSGSTSRSRKKASIALPR